jgi:signal transduction histidine kinase
LGLSIVKHIVNLYKGDIQLESKVGEGSVFSVRLPIILKDKH